MSSVDEGRKRVLGIIAGILVARHLKTTEDLFDTKPSPRTESLVACAVQWAERIMRKVDSATLPRTVSWSKQTVNYSGFEPPQEADYGARNASKSPDDL